jgi:NADPH2:quinone reductase
MTTAKTMQAAVLDNHGAPFRIASIPQPYPQPGQVLVRIEAGAVNPRDIKIRAGQAAHARQRLPAILGIDLAGIVEAVDDGVTTFRHGDEVYGMTVVLAVCKALWRNTRRSMPICLRRNQPISPCVKLRPCR